MPGFKELVEDFDLIEEGHRVEGTRSFYKATGGSASLPVLGDAFSGDFPQSIARKIRHVKFFPDPDDRSVYIEKQTISYSSNPTGDRIIFPDLELRRFQMGGEIIAVEDPKNWEWDTDNAKVDQPMFISNIMGSFTRQVVFGSDGQKDSWIANKMIPTAGTINSGTFEAFRAGSVLFSGVSGGNQSDQFGNRSWVFDLEFTYRIIRDETVAIIGDDWLFLWRKDFSGLLEGRWDKPKDKEGRFLYQKKNLNQLFT